MTARIALMIDAENISYKNLPHILKEADRQGETILRAVYGNWEAPHLQNWHDIAQKHDFTIRDQRSTSQVKNSTDMKLIMDAVEVLHFLKPDVFCLVTNDADYIPLCDKLHESGKYVIGIGDKHAAEALIRACDQFIFIKQTHTPTETISELPKQLEVPKPINPPAIRKLLSKAFARAPKDHQGWVTLSALGSALSQVQTDFQTSTYGHANLTKLLQSMPDFVEIHTQNNVSSARLKSEAHAVPQKQKELRKLISKAFETVPHNTEGWVTLSALGNALRQIQANFQTSTYGHSNLTKLLQSMPDFVEIHTQDSVKSARRKNK